jgi:hypothetical protein
VTLCLEPLSPAETNFINTAEEALRFVEPFHSPRFQIILDVKAMCAETKPIPQLIAESRGPLRAFPRERSQPQGPRLRRGGLRAHRRGA